MEEVANHNNERVYKTGELMMDALTLYAYY